MTLSNEVDRLLEYFESQKVSSKEPEPQIKIDPQQKIQTKKLIEECQENIFSDIPLKPTSSKSFDVEKLEDLMRSKLVDEHKKLQSYERPYISVTEIFNCLRRAYYSRLKYEVDIRSQYRFSYLYLINNVGDKIHELIQEIYDFSETEKTIVSEKYKVKGRVDAIRGSVLYELKSIDQDKFKNRYIKEHFYQGLIYSYILNSEYNYSIDTISIVYIIRNLKKIFPFDLTYEAKKAEIFLNNALILRNALDSHNVPDPICSKEEECKYCPYRVYCEKDVCSAVVQPFNQKRKKMEKSQKPKKKETIFLM